MSRRLLTAGAAASLLFGTALAGSPAFAAAPASTARPTTVLNADVVGGLNQLRPVSATNPDTRVEVDLVLGDSHAAAEQALYTAIYTKGNPEYHHFLTPAAFAAEFGVPRATVEAARSFATADGLRVVNLDPAGDLIVLSGTAAQAERTFGVSLDNYSYKGLDFYANTAAPRVPAGLDILGVVGLNSAQRMHTFHTAPATSAPHGPTPKTTTCDPTNSVCVGITTPQDLWNVYNQPASDMGQGQSLAIFGEGDFTGPISDLRLFEAHFKFPQVPVKVIAVDGGPVSQYTDTSGDIEWDLDTQSSTGMAPDVAQLDLYFGTSLDDADVLNMFSTWAADPNGPKQASASFGECEASPVNDQLPSTAQFAAGESFQAGSEQALTAANLEGRTLFSSAGDTGSSCPLIPVSVNGVGNEAYPDVNYPCASPHVVCVGGTVLYTDGATPGNRVTEYAWPYTGGGTSFEFPEPAFQTSQSAVDGVCLYGPGGNTAGTGVPCRGVPDVAAQSGDVISNGYDIYIAGQFSEEGGTSLSSPLWDGMWTRIQAAAPLTSNGYTDGFADPALYAHPGDFYDIGAGTNDSPPTSNGYYHSGPGWDYLSGLGSPNVTELAKDISGSTTPTVDEASPNTGTVTVVTPQGATLSSGSTTPASDPACVPLWVDSSPDAVFADDPTGTDYPQLDIVQGDMHNTGTTLKTVLTIANMADAPASTPPYGTANEYYMYWTFGGTTYFTNAEVSVAGTIAYNYGTVSKVGTTNSYSPTGSATGSITTGPDGTVEVDVPLSDVGSPPSTATLTGIGAETMTLEGAPSPLGTGLLETLDTDSAQYNYTLGETCAATGLPGSDGGAAPSGGSAPEAPFAVLIPLLGLAVLATVAIRRRRRLG
jgi:subtilase family serine protease